MKSNSRAIPTLTALLLNAAASVAAAASECADGAETCGGFRFDATYTGEPIRNMSGGLRTGGTYLDNLDLQLAADRGSFVAIPGLSALVYLLGNNSRDFSDKYVGDAQGVSNIEAQDAWGLYEAWLDWATAGRDEYSVRLGLYDLNSEFDSIETASLFLNSSHGIGTDYAQSGLNGPSIFPATALALRLKVDGASGYYAQAAVLDGNPGDLNDSLGNRVKLSDGGGALLAAEFGWSGAGWRKLALGGWWYTGDFEPLTATTSSGEPLTDNGNAGFYAIADRTVWSGDAATVAAFLRLGTAEDKYNPFDTYIGTGVTVAGFWPSRPDDVVGLAMATVLAGDRYRDTEALDGVATDHYETNLELTYRTRVTDWLVLQPDMQYIINPGVDPALDNALTVSLRFEISFSRPL